jgi:hypothetical protein
MVSPETGSEEFSEDVCATREDKHVALTIKMRIVLKKVIAISGEPNDLIAYLDNQPFYFVQKNENGTFSALLFYSNITGCLLSSLLLTLAKIPSRRCSAPIANLLWKVH